MQYLFLDTANILFVGDFKINNSFIISILSYKILLKIHMIQKEYLLSNNIQPDISANPRNF